MQDYSSPLRDRHRLSGYLRALWGGDGGQKAEEGRDGKDKKKWGSKQSYDEPRAERHLAFSGGAFRFSDSHSNEKYMVGRHPFDCMTKITQLKISSYVGVASIRHI